MLRLHRTLLAVGLVALVGSAFAAGPDDHPLTRRTPVDTEARIRGFVEFDSACHARDIPAITVVEPPAHGRVDLRPGLVTIGPNWVGTPDCSGTKLDGMFVYYVPAPGYTGHDRFRFDVAYQRNRTAHATVDMDVDPPAAP